MCPSLKCWNTAPAVYRAIRSVRPGGRRAGSSQLMPELLQMFPDIPSAIVLPPEQQRRFLLNACRAFMEGLARRTPRTGSPNVENPGDIEAAKALLQASITPSDAFGLALYSRLAWRTLEGVA